MFIVLRYELLRITVTDCTTVVHCEVCKVSFAQRWRLTRHFKTQKHQSNVELLATEYLPHSDSPPEV